jgi:hypothetical protein
VWATPYSANRMPTTWTSFLSEWGTEWGNFENWLRGDQGWILYVMLFVVIGLIPVLIVMFYKYSRNRLGSFPALPTWALLDLLPSLLVTFGLAAHTPSPIFAVFYVFIPALVCTVPLLAGVSILHQRQRTGRLPAILIWLGLALPPVVPAYLFFSFGPSVGTTLILLSAAPLFAGLIAFAAARPSVYRAAQETGPSV